MFQILRKKTQLLKNISYRETQKNLIKNWKSKPNLVKIEIFQLLNWQINKGFRNIVTIPKIFWQFFSNRSHLKGSHSYSSKSKTIWKFENTIWDNLAFQTIDTAVQMTYCRDLFGNHNRKDLVAKYILTMCIFLNHKISHSEEIYVFGPIMHFCFFIICLI